MIRLLAFLLTLAGCPAPDPNGGLPPTTSAQSLDWAGFVCNAQPVLLRHCAFSACHGNADHALRLYSPGKLRRAAIVTRQDRDTTLSATEVADNYLSTGGLVWPTTGVGPITDPAQIQLLGKPLATSFGGSQHQGIAVFPVYPADIPGNDPEWKALRDWAEGTKAARPFNADCQALFDALQLDPNGPKT